MKENEKKYDPRKDTIKSLINSVNNNNNTSIDFNYPSLNRKDLMDLSQINTKSCQFKKLNTNRDWSLNLYNLDIEGSCPRKFSYFTNKKDFTNKNNDIEKSTPKSLYNYTNKISFNLKNDDIELSKPQCNKNLSNRHTNPLTPKYSFSKPELYPPEIPKFIRDSIDIKDIKGSAPNYLGYDKKLFKFPIKKEKIEKSYPKPPYIRKTRYEYMDYQDVTKKKIIYRNTNPLRPQYKWTFIEDNKLLGPIEGNYPLVYSKYIYRNPFNLSTKDIEGANTGSKCPILRYKGNTFYLNTKDINGAQGDTLIRGIITKRHINPITPVYQYLGHSEIQNIDNNPYFNQFKNNKVENTKKIKNTNEDKIKNKTVDELRALNRKLIMNKFLGHLSKNISDNNIESKTELKKKFFDINKFNKLKEQLRPINKRKINSDKNYSTST